MCSIYSKCYLLDMKHLYYIVKVLPRLLDKQYIVSVVYPSCTKYLHVALSHHGLVVFVGEL